MSSFYLTIENEKLVVHHEKVVTPVTSREQLIGIFTKYVEETGIDPEDLRVQSSSSLDFPDEYTTDKDTLELVAWVNGH